MIPSILIFMVVFNIHKDWDLQTIGVLNRNIKVNVCEMKILKNVHNAYIISIS